MLSVKTIGLAANSLLPGAAVFHEQPVSYLFQNYLDALITSDSMPLLLPIQAPERAAQAIEKVDALILAGGQDISPELYHQEPHQALGQTYLPRDQWEIALMQAAIEAQKPVLGICRGLQLINVGLGGTLDQDLALVPTTIKHMQAPTAEWLGTHNVTITESFLSPILGERYRVNSLHHQVVHTLAPGLDIVATANDQVIEAFADAERNIYAVQWHPEMMASHDPNMQQLFNWFVSL